MSLLNLLKFWLRYWVFGTGGSCCSRFGSFLRILWYVDHNENFTTGINWKCLDFKVFVLFDRRKTTNHLWNPQRSSVWFSKYSFVVKAVWWSPPTETCDQDGAGSFGSAHSGDSSLASPSPSRLLYFLTPCSLFIVYQSQSVLAFDVIWLLFLNSLLSLSSYFPPFPFVERCFRPWAFFFFFPHWVYIWFHFSFSARFIMWTYEKKGPNLKLSDFSWSLSLRPLLTSHSVG